MRNPLGVALNSLDMLEGLLGEDETAREIIKIAMLGVSRIQDLIDDLLNLEHLESGYGFNLSECRIGDLVDEVSAEMRPLLDEHKLTFSAEVEAGIPILPVDRKWVVRAMLNYLTNACKYTHQGGHIHLRVFTQTPFLHIEVVDNGPGIPAEAQARLFERFYRANASNTNIPGTGLGLAIVKSVAEAHGGSVYVQSRPGQGSTFGMTLLMQGA
jgi:signal transduction histidine kinase